MRIHDKAIVLQSVKHGDRQSIVKLYTRGHGLVTVIASAGRSPSSKIKAASLLPLNLLDINYTARNTREIQRLSEATSYYVHGNLSSSLAKLGIAQFINEVLIKSLKEQQSNEKLYDFIEGCLNYLNDSEKDFVNLHLYFLRELSTFLGFEPHNNYDEHNRYFDSREGGFTPMALPFPLGLAENDSKVFSEFLTINPLKTHITYQQRSLLLDIWLAYYNLHVPNFGELRSLEVLKEVGRVG
jgi:DNA repair protein RecO (recombination protein O)